MQYLSIQLPVMLYYMSFILYYITLLLYYTILYLFDKEKGDKIKHKPNGQSVRWKRWGCCTVCIFLVWLTMLGSANHTVHWMFGATVGHSTWNEWNSKSATICHSRHANRFHAVKRNYSMSKQTSNRHPMLGNSYKNTLPVISTCRQAFTTHTRMLVTTCSLPTLHIPMYY